MASLFLFEGSFPAVSGTADALTNSGIKNKIASIYDCLN